jgi:predicted ATPase/signal transduction histidine kinase/tRNA A-37 threonylcarbamoyl transferase component Bud32
MITLKGYQITDLIYESVNSQIYRAIREENKQGIILKVLRSDYPTAAELTRYKQEYEITRKLNLEGVIRAYSLEKYGNSLAIAIEDIDAKSLKSWMSEKTWTLEEFLELSIKIAKALSQVHAENIVHKDINPSNIIFNPATGELKIIDFGIASQLTRENPTLKNPNVLEGTLAYISPEQTGRMNRSLDYRTDFYSLGVTFYEMLTGQLPFATKDAMELVHCHLAKTPLLPQELNPEIPPIVGKIVMKLLEKNAEKRYQSGMGIAADLETCLTQLRETRKIEEFPLGKKDISEKFQIPQKLYGREREIDDLLGAFEGVAVGQIDGDTARIEMMLVAGYSGIGKTSIVQEIYKPVTEKRGYFISGKFDQFQTNIPYSAVVSAFKELVRQLLSETEEELNKWRAKLLAAFGQNGQVIIDVIPEVELIVGKQPPVPELGPSESQNRFDLVFENFIRACASKEHPLVIFLDDLQWVDAATLKLIELMMTDAEGEYLLLIGAYRDNEVSATHPLTIALDKLRQGGATIGEIILAPLELEHIGEAIAETLKASSDRVAPLASLVWQKTMGNPFFVKEFLKTLYAEGSIAFDRDRLRWEWDLERIETENITDNVVDLTIANLKKLPAGTQETLSLAACIGATFDLETLAIVSEVPPEAVFSRLMPALQFESIAPLSELDANLLIQQYKFGHDRIQQAAYALVDEEEKQFIHLKIGRLLWQNTDEEALSDRLFEIADSLNLGIKLVEDSEEKEAIAKLNLIAGQKALVANAYQSAVSYLKIVLDLLDTDSWHRHYEFTFNTYATAIDAAYLSTNFALAKELSDMALDRANNVLDRVKILEKKLIFSIAENILPEVLQLGKEVLKNLGVSLPEADSDPLVLAEDIREKMAAKGINKIEELANLKTMEEPEKQAALRILMILFAPILIGFPHLMPLLGSKMVDLCVEYGNCNTSPYAYVFYGWLNCGVLNNIDDGYQFGQLGVSLLNQFETRELKCKTKETFNGFIKHWKDDLHLTVNPLRDCIREGLETGDLEYAGYSATIYCYNIFFVGMPLDYVTDEQAKYVAMMQKNKQDFLINYTSIIRQLGLNLRGKARSKLELIGEAFNETKTLPVLISTNTVMSVFSVYLCKTVLCYLLKDYEKALANARLADEIVVSVGGMNCFAEHYFYYSLVLLGLAVKAEDKQKQEYLEIVALNQEKMKIWAEKAPINFQHKYDLIEAEKMRVLGENWQAIETYEGAIAGAQNNEYLHEEALACELAAEFYLERNLKDIAKTYLTKAHYGYSLWGATAKVKDLEANYPQFVGDRTQMFANKTEKTITTTGADTASFSLDVNSIVKASQTLAEEIVLENLLAKMMKIIVENAGAEKGCLILEKDNNFAIEASGFASKNSFEVLQSLPIDNNVPASIVNYVARTKQTVVLNDASGESKFADDSYIKQNKPKSILCAPMVNQGKLTGIIYLENNLVAGAFTSDRVETIGLLSTQASISIDNATLYRTLEQKVADRTRELSNALENLQTTQGQLIESEKMASLGSLVAGVAHEINTPVGNSITAASLLVSRTTSFTTDFEGGNLKKSALKTYLDTMAEGTKLIFTNLERAGELIKSFKQVAVDRSSLDRRKFPVVDYVREVLISLKPQLKTTQHTVSVKGDEEIILDSYPGALSQVITNLVVNSLHHGYNGNEAGKLEFEIGKNGDRLILLYKDDGCGISPENLDKIFEPFFTTARDRGGSGLGLHIVYNLVTQTLQGKITCKSTVGEGTKFVLDLPLG